MKQKIENEAGRSMVEMLGVLAVIGVLSVMGIAGYQKAMRHYRANEIVNAISMLVVVGEAMPSLPPAGLTYQSAFGVAANPDGVEPEAGSLVFQKSAEGYHVDVFFENADICLTVQGKFIDEVSGQSGLVIANGHHNCGSETPSEAPPFLNSPAHRLRIKVSE